MKCHYIYDKEAGKVLIPGCIGVANSGRMEDCTCRSENIRQFDKEEFNKILKSKNELIKEFERENARLNRELKKIYSKK